MRIVLTSDLHGALPDIGPCDLLLIAGDVCPVENHDLDFQRNWLQTVFADWLEKTPAEQIVGIAGNHDFIFEAEKVDLPWTYLQDAEATVNGLRIWGSPWVPNLRSWAFYGGPGRVRGTIIDAIPSGIDILLSHGPMYGAGDRVMDGMYVGCKEMLNQIKRISPKLFVCGHIHEGYGAYSRIPVEYGVYNVAHMDVLYRPVQPPISLDAF